MEEKVKKYCYSFDDEYYIGGIFDSKEKAIEDAKKEWDFHNWEKDYDEKAIYIAEAIIYEDDFDYLADDLIESMQNLALRENEYAEGYMEVSKEHQLILASRLKNMILKFQKEFGYNPMFYEVGKDREKIKF